MKRRLDRDELENDYQKAANKLNQIITRHDVSLSAQKKILAFKGGDQVRSKIVLDNKIIEKVNSFHYVGNLIL